MDVVVLGTPGLVWRTSGDNRIAYWQCRTDIAKLGYPVRRVNLWVGKVGTKPSDEEMVGLRRECHRLQSEMKEWRRHGDARRPSKQMRENGEVYFAKCGSLIKIGYAKNAQHRMSQLRVSSPFKIEFLGSLPGNRQIEKFLHWQFRKSIERGEWFHETDDLRQFIEANVNGIANGMANAGERKLDDSTT